MTISGEVFPLLFVSGTGQGVELKLESEIVTFGAVVQNASSTQYVKIKNIGDIATKFSWDISKLSSEFFISPLDGFLNPAMDMDIKVVFKPLVTNPDIRTKVACYVEGMYIFD